MVKVSEISYSNETYKGSTILKNVDLAYVPFDNNSMAYAFDNCKNLQSVINVNDNITNMSYCFEDCYNLTSTPILPNSVKDLSGCFYYCNKLTSTPVLPYGVEDLSYAFMHCNNLTSFPNIPNTVSSMSMTFFYSSNMQGDIYVESSRVNSVSSCFSGTKSNRTHYIPLGNCQTHRAFNSAGYKTNIVEHPEYMSVGDWYYYKKDKSIVTYMGSAETLSVPSVLNSNSVNYMDPSVFYNCQSIKSVDLNNIPTYNNSMFQMFFNCQNLSSVSNISNTVSSMRYTFSNCINLVNVSKLPENTIDMFYTFNGCSNLVNAPELPDSVQTMVGTFANCQKITNAPIIPNSVTNIANCFRNCKNITDAPVIPCNVTNACFSFWNCENLVNIPTLPNSIIDLGYAFINCDKLTDAPVIPGSVTDIGYTFSSCDNLVNIPELPNSITNMYSAFQGCSNLVNAPNIPNSATDIGYVFSNCPNLVNAPQIPNNVTRISGAFSNCYSFNSTVVIPETVNDMGWAFSNCSNLNSEITILGNDEIYQGQGIFYNCSNLSILPNVDFNRFVDIKSIFYNCQNLTSVPDVGPNTYNIVYAFTDCRNITSGPTIYATELQDATSAFKNCVNMVTAPDMNRVSRIGYWDSGMNGCFDGCTSLTGNIYIGASEIRYVYNCFNNTSLIKNVYIPFESNAYNAFINAGYDELGTNNGVYLKPHPDFGVYDNSFYVRYSNAWIMKYVGNGSTVLPTSINGVPVLNITELLFYGNEDITSIDLSNSNVFASQMNRAFSGCSNLTTVSNIPVNTVNMSKTFEDCTNLTGDIFINTENIIGAYNCFSGSYNKNVYIPLNATQSSSINMIGWSDAYGDFPYVMYTKRDEGDYSVNVYNENGILYPGTEYGYIEHFSEEDVRLRVYYRYTDDEPGYELTLIRNTSADKTIIKNVGDPTDTYTAFMAAGYSTTSRVNGVLLMDIYPDIDLSDWTYTVNATNDVVLTKYVGSNNEIILPHL